MKILFRPFGQINNNISVDEIKYLSNLILKTDIDNFFAESIYIDQNDPLFKFRTDIKLNKPVNSELINEIISVDSF